MQTAGRGPHRGFRPKAQATKAESAMPAVAAQSGSPRTPKRHRASTEGGARAEEDAQDPRLGVHMAVHTSCGRVGLAWYDATSAELRCMEGADEERGALRYRLVQLAKLHAAPAVIYVSSKADAGLVAALKEPLTVSADGAAAAAAVNDRGAAAQAAAAGEFEVRVEKASLFHPRQARHCLEAVHLPGMPPGLDPRGRLHLINTMVTLSAEQQVCAVGALLAVLSRDGLLAPDPTAPAAAMPLASLAETSLQGHLLVDPASMEALHIFHDEAHPSAMGIGRAKEGLSAFGLLNRCISPPGRRLLRLWFARPLVDLAALEGRLDGVEYLMRRPDEAGALRALLRGVKDAARLLVRLQGMQTLPDSADFLALQGSLAATLRIRDALMELEPMQREGSHHEQQSHPHQQAGAWQADAGILPEHSTGSVVTGSGAELLRTLGDPSRTLLCAGTAKTAGSILHSLAASISDELVTCHNLVASVIDPSQEPEGLCIHYGVSQELDDMKAAYFGLPDLLAHVARHEVARLPQYRAAAVAASGGWEVAYLPQVGFVLQVEAGLLGADILERLPDYELAFEGCVVAGGAAVGSAPGACYHTDTTRELTQRFGDMLPKIQDLEGALCSQVVVRLAAFAPAIRAAADAAAHLDCLLSLASAALELHLTRPLLTEANVLRIKGGRHLLTELLVERFIPNDTAMGSHADRVHVITGPNLSGKSCYAKQVALIAFLAHVGSFVPAEEAEIGLVDRIFTRVATREAAAVPQSTFMIDLSQVGAMLRLATPRSLLIIDEFGKGTLAADGVGLLCAAAAHLAGQGSLPNGNDAGAPHQRQPCPRVFLCTHFTEVLDPAYLPRCPQLAFHTMGVLVEGGEQPGGAQGSGGAATVQGVQRGTQAGRPGLVFLYRLLPGHVAPSFGLHCARVAGVVESVLERAGRVIEAHAKGDAVPPPRLPRLQHRTAAFEDLVQRLLTLNTRSAEGGRELVRAVAAAVTDA